MNKIYVGNLHFQTTEQNLDDTFQQFGTIKEIAIIKDRYTNECRGFAFITFDTPESAQNALTLDGQELQGRAMKISIAKNEKKEDRRPPNNRFKRNNHGYSGGRSDSFGGRGGHSHGGGGRRSGGNGSSGGRGRR